MNNARMNALVLALSCIFAVLLGNLALGLYTELQPAPKELDLRQRQAAAKRQGLPFDGRRPGEAILAMRAEGRDVVPLVHPRGYLAGLDVGGRRILPLSGIANATCLYSNEGGHYPLYETDELGFNNPRGVHGRGAVDIALLGDSFTFGIGVDSPENIASVLGRLGLPCVNYGHGGNGPLLNLAILTEYVLAENPRLCVWLYYGNDLDDMLIEQGTPLLLRYLEDPTFRQGLAELQPQIDAALRVKEEESLRSRSANYEKPLAIGRLFLDAAMLRPLRGRLGLAVHRPDPGRYEKAAPTLVRALAEAKRRVEARGGRLLVVYLPGGAELVGQGDNNEQYAIALRAFAQTGVTYLDLRPVLSADKDPARFFPFGMLGSHYSPAGYEFVARQIHAWLVDVQGRPAR